ncbi:hypothetical protein EIK77_008804 [Talaromyces pinophilus]|nr:hypothetical protein EIK77_008804 [Talaromyces pinophilus]
MDNTNHRNDVSLRVTAFLIPNIHCPTCVSHIEESLDRLDPKPVSVSHSIVNHTVIIRHVEALNVRDITKAIEAAGYDVSSVIGDPYFDNPVVWKDREIEAASGSGNGSLEHTLQRWTSRMSDIEEQGRKKKRHMENCESCHAKQGRQGSDTSLLPAEGNSKLIGQESGGKDEEDLHEASLSIARMTCSSCVGRITNAFESKSWIRFINVNLLTNSATLTYVGKQHTGEILPVLTELGYTANIEAIRDVSRPGSISRPPVPDLWKASYTVGGITCSSCVASITNALKKPSWVRDVDVNLITHDAVVVLEDKRHVDEIRNMIEDLGYETSLDEAVAFNGDAEKSTWRTVAIRVDNMYCEHCPPKVINALRQFDQLTVEKALTAKDPVLHVLYRSKAPNFTIRHILSSISKSDPAFEPSIYQPMSMEERSRRMRIREQWQILYRLVLSVLAAIPTLIIGVIYMNLVSSSDPGYIYLMHPVVGGVSRAEWALFAMATPVYFLAADIFHRRTLKELRALWRPGSAVPVLRRLYRFGSMNMLISFGTSIAYISSLVELGISATQISGMITGMTTYFDSVVFLTMFLLMGRLIEAYSKAKTGDAVSALGKLRPAEALLVVQDELSRTGTERIPVVLLEFGDVVRVLHGDSPPCDGIILQGESMFDESSLTGESKPIAKVPGDTVYSGTVNEGDAISIRITGAAGSSMLDQIMAVVREGQARRAPVERIADTITGYFVPVVTLIAIATWIIWLVLGLAGTLPADYRDTNIGGWPFWTLQFAIAVFVIACPCGLGLAAPTALFVGGGLAAQHGILVKGGGEAFQEASQIDCIVFDKTGTLTQGGEPTITDHQLFPGDENGHLTEEILLGLVKKLEEDSSHPIAKAIVQFCEAQQTSDVHVRGTEVVAGKGIKGSFTIGEAPGRIFQGLVGNEALMMDHNVQLTDNVIATLNRWKSEAKSIALVATAETSDDKEVPQPTWVLSSSFAVSDPLRPEAPGVVREIQRQGVEVWMISGDNAVTAYAVGAKVGIPKSNIIAGVLPEQKADRIRYLQRSAEKRETRNLFGWKFDSVRQRATVAMVGDGINDSPALTMADVGIAIGSGADIAISAAKFVLITGDLTSVLTLVDLSHVVFRRVKFNFLWACVYNLVALPIAAGVLYPIRSGRSHVRLDPVWASLAMALSSISVVCSSLLLRSSLPVVGFRVRRPLAEVGDV